jgi:hypothetical protein
MKGIGRHITAAILLAVAGAIFLAAGIADRALVRTQEHAVALTYTESEEAFDTAEQYLRYASWIPSVRGRLDDLQARRASMRYWRRQYDRIAPPDTDPLAGIPPENVDLQLIAANAAYRKPVLGDRSRQRAPRTRCGNQRVCGGAEKRRHRGGGL